MTGSLGSTHVGSLGSTTNGSICYATKGDGILLGLGVLEGVRASNSKTLTKKMKTSLCLVFGAHIKP